MTTAAQTLLTLQEVPKRLRGLSDTELVQQTLIDDTDEIETILNRKIVSRGTITEFHPAVGRSLGAELYLSEAPMLTITSVHEDPDRSYGSSTLLVKGTDYLVDSRDDCVILIRISGGSPIAWNSSFEAVKVIWTAGYTQATVPGDIKRIASELLAMHYADNAEKRFRESSRDDGIGGRSFYGPAELTSHMIKRLGRHRFPAMARATLSRYTVA